MEVALIAPVSLLETTACQKFHMMLPAIVGDSTYDEFYKKLSGTEGYYVILDNGAWEDSSLSAQELMDIAYKFRVQEIVVPDIINGRPEDTLDMMRVFFNTAAVSGTYYGDWSRPKYSAVVHGSSVTEARDFIDIVAEKFPQITVFSLAKRLPLYTSDRDARAKMTDHIIGRYADRFEIHLLGYNEWIPDELRIRVRSIDMTTPYTSSLKHMSLQVSDNIRVSRPRDYFKLGPEAFDMGILARNIDYIVRAADR